MLTMFHWGVYEVVRTDNGEVALAPFAQDPSPSLIGKEALAELRGPLRIRRPSVRKSWLESRRRGRRHECAPELRGREPFVEVEWDEAIALVADELTRVRREHGNEAIFGGSYGWASAGRFNHAQSQIHRFLNCIGGFVRHVGTYSLGAARTLMPHIVAPIDDLFTEHTTWHNMEKHTELFVSFGGVPAKNSQISSGGASSHGVQNGLNCLARKNVRLINISPDREDLKVDGEVDWIPIRPGTDTALILSLIHCLISSHKVSENFLHRYCVGWTQVASYVSGSTDGIEKNADWAAKITGIAAARIQELANDMVSNRTMLNMAWSLQRARYGEQPYWALVTLASALGQIGAPGGGFALGYGANNALGNDAAILDGLTLPQGNNPIKNFIPVARLTDMLLEPGQQFEFNGGIYDYPEIHLIYWAGGNPFHHQQDLNRLLKAWRSMPETVIMHEQFWTASAKLSDIVLPATTALERDDIGYAKGEDYIIAMHKALDAPDDAKDDYWIFSQLAESLGVREEFTRGLDAGGWLTKMYEKTRKAASARGIELPAFAEFWDQGYYKLPRRTTETLLQCFIDDPSGNPLSTKSGKIELYSREIAGFRYADCPGQASWFPSIGSESASAKFPIHLLTDQPFTKLHSQLDHGAVSQGDKICGREPIRMAEADATARGIITGDLVKVSSQYGACLAGARVVRNLLPGVAKLATGAWLDLPSLDAQDEVCVEYNGNGNVLTGDKGTSRLCQGSTAQSCFVEIVKYKKVAPTTQAYKLPVFVSSQKLI